MESLLYAGCSTDRGGSGLYCLAFDGATGAVRPSAAAAQTPNPTWIAPSPCGHFVYAVQSTGGENGSGAASAFRVDGVSGGLSPLGSTPLQCDGACSAVVHPSGRLLLVAHYGGGGVSTLPIDPATGGLSPAPQVWRIPGGGAGVAMETFHGPRAEAPHPHSVVLDPGGGRVLVPDLGGDRIHVLDIDVDAGLLRPAAELATAPGSGPRHLEFHPNGRWCYAAHEIACTVEALSYDAATGALCSLAPPEPALPGDWPGGAVFGAGGCPLGTSTSEVRVSADGRFVYVGVRVVAAEGLIAAYAVDERTGCLRGAGHHPTGGIEPRHFRLDPSGAWCLVAHCGELGGGEENVTGAVTADTVVVHAVDRASGALSRAAGVAPLLIPMPECLQFVPRRASEPLKPPGAALKEAACRVLPAMVTPLLPDGTLDVASAERCVDACLGPQRTGGLYVCGATGEGFFLPVALRKQMAELCVARAAGRGRCIVQVAATATDDAYELARHAAAVGADAVSSVPPFLFGQYDIEARKRYYTRLALESGLPVVGYHLPKQAGPLSMAELAEFCATPGLVGLKYSDHNFFVLERLLDTSVSKDQLIYTGPDEQFALGQLLGAHGGIGATYSYMVCHDDGGVNAYVKVAELMAAGAQGEAFALQAQINKVIETIIELEGKHGPAPHKAILYWQGLVDHTTMAADRHALSPGEAAELHTAVSATFLGPTLVRGLTPQEAVAVELARRWGSAKYPAPRL
jgi:6-phosphogluconolactonase